MTAPRIDNPRMAMALLMALAISLMSGCSRKIDIPGTVFEFILSDEKKHGIFATSSLGEITDAQVMENPVTLELRSLESKAKLAAILRHISKIKEPPKGSIEIYLEAPAQRISLPVTVEFKPLPPKSDEDLVAKLGAEEVYLSQLNYLSVGLMAQRMRAYKNSITLLRNVLVTMALDSASKNDGLDRQRFIDKHMTMSPLTDAEFLEFLNTKGIKKNDLDANSEHSLKLVAAEFRKQNAIESFVVGRYVNQMVEIHHPPPENQIDLPKDWRTSWGFTDAPIRVIYFGDLSCELCRGTLNTLLNLEQEYRGHINLEFSFFFDQKDNESRVVAEASLCALQQRPEYFQKFSQQVLDNPPRDDRSKINQAIKDIGANLEEYQSCLLDPKHADLLDQQLSFAFQIGVSALPTVFIDGEPLDGAMSEERLGEAIERKVSAKSSVIRAWWRRMKRALF